jgi:phospholipid transport system substrate-binding protein
MKGLFYAVLSIIFLCPTVMADDKGAVEELLRNRIDTVISLLKNKDLKQQEKNKKITEIVMPMFNFSVMAKLSLGKKYWPGLSEKKKEEFKGHFTKLLKASYLEKLGLYTDEKIVYKASIKIRNKIHIPTDLISKGNKISMLYKLYKAKSGWKIYDIEIQGVSIIRTYRSQFDQVLRKGTFNDLLLELEKLGNK